MSDETIRPPQRVELTPVEFDPFGGAPAETVLPLTGAQQEMWAACAMGPEASCSYNQCFPIRLSGPLAVSSLKASIARLTARRDALRAVFAADARTQTVLPEIAVDLPIVDLSDREPGVRDAELAALIDAETRQPFDLERGPLLRAKLVREASRRHVLILTAHHIVCDGWSAVILVRDLAALYSADLAGGDAPLPPPVSYAEYVNAHAAQGGGEKARADEDWWAARFPDVPPALDLPFDRPLPPAKTFRGLQIASRIDEPLYKAIRSVGAKCGATLYATFLAAFEVLLHRLTGQRDFVVGIPFAGQSAIEDGDLVGHCVNTLPLRVAVDPEASFAAHLRSARSALLEAQEHTDLTFGSLVQRLNIPRDPRRTPLVDITFNVDRVGAAPVFAGLSLEFLPPPKSAVNFEIGVNLVDDGHGVDVECAFNLDVLDESTVRRWLGHYESLLRGIASDPEARILDLPILTEAERRQVLVDWCGGTARYPGDTCLHRGFEAQVARTPEAIALTFEGSSLTYDELNRRANRLAHRLIGLGVRPDTLVGLCTDRSIDLVVGILGILKAGGAYLPLDPTYPAERLSFLLEDAAAPVVVTQEAHRGLVAGSRAASVVLDAEAEGLAAAGDGNPDTGVGADATAYVIYTSGSTGRPKGVLVTHRNVARLMEATAPWYRFDAQDVWTLFHSYAFDFSVWELWGALLYGGRLVVVPYWVSRSPEAFHELLRTERVTVLNQTPSAFRQLIQADLAAGTPAEAMALRYVIFGGEALELQSLRPWFQRYGDRRPQLVNMYGITETTVHVTYRPIRLADVAGGAGSVIGEPIPDLQVYVLDPARAPVPIGVPGEMYVGGAGVARGYLNREALTAERFVAHPFDATPGARLYRTGDLARRLPSGDLEYLGRIDLQVKIRGFRIELGEIESVIGQHPAVREVVVLAREDAPGDKRLVAYVVAPGAGSSLVEELRTLLRSKLPDYMVPAHVVVLDALPLTAHGKVDRKALPAPDLGRRHGDRPYVAPRTPAEETMARIWASVLGVERVSVDDNFFELGGDSILSIQVVARCRQSGLAISPRDLFKSPTIAALAGGAAPSAERSVVEGPVSGVVPLTPIQHWFFEQDLPDAHHWNQSFLFETAADLDVDVLERALHEAVRHHDAFRLRFTREAAGWRQEYGAEPAAPPLLRVDLSALPEELRGEALAARAAALQAKLDLSEGPLVRAAHFDFGPEARGRLLLVIHHLAVDGVSWRILLEDVESAYGALRQRRDVSLPRKTTSLRRWSERLSAYAASDAPRRSREHWIAVGGADVAKLPADHPEGDDLEASAETVASALDADETRALLQRVPAAYRTQVNDVLLTALARTLAAWTRRDAVLIDLEGHGREDLFEDVDLSRTVGWFTTIYPVRLELPAASDDGAALRSIKEQLRRVPDRGLSYGVLAYLAKDPSLAGPSRPKAELIFNYLGQFDQVVAGSSLFAFAPEPTGPWHSPRARRRHALEVFARVADGRLEVRWIYGAARYDRETIAALAQSYTEALRALIRHAVGVSVPVLTPSDVPLAGVDQAGLDRLARDYPSLEDAYPLPPMQRLFLSMDASGFAPGLEEWRFAIDGDIEASRLERAWEILIERHPMLRTAFVADGFDAPLQVVLPRAELPWREEDLRGAPDDAQRQALARILREERERGFDVSRAPLMRVTLVRLADRRAELIWITHHLYIDGWSWPVVIADLSAIYAALGEGRDAGLPAACSYAAYVRWLATQAPDSESFWRSELAGIDAPTPIDLDSAPPSPADGAEPGEVAVALPAAATERLRELARDRQSTLSAVVQTAWATVLAHVGGTSDVVFGAAFSGRPAEIPGIAGMVGPCVNNVPVRIRVDGAETVAALLARVQAKQADLGHHQYAPLARIQEWSGVPLRLRLFDSLIVFQNYVVDDAARRLGRDASVSLIHGPDATNYPLTLTVVPGPEMRLKLLYNRGRFSQAQAATMLGHLTTVLGALADSATAPMSAVLGALPAETAGRAAAVAAARRSRAAATYAAPGTATEQAVAAIWRELFQADRVGLDDNFFDLGGHSILLLQAHQRLREQLRADLPVVALFQYPTVRSLARFLSGGATDAASRGAKDRAQKQRDALARIKAAHGRKT